MMLPGCYKPTVNESETIAEAQPYCLFRGRGETIESQVFGFGLAMPPHLERS
jgi:hypothetical protein